jgi:hypothetical protein
VPIVSETTTERKFEIEPERKAITPDSTKSVLDDSKDSTASLDISKSEKKDMDTRYDIACTMK